MCGARAQAWSGHAAGGRLGKRAAPHPCPHGWGSKSEQLAAHGLREGVEKLHLIARLTASASSILTPLLDSLSLARAAYVRLCSPMWQGLKLAYEQLFPTGIVDASGTRKVVVVVSDGLATKGYSGGRFNRPTYLTLVQATALKDKGTLLMAIGFGSAHRDSAGNLGTSGCEPFACSDGGIATFLGTNLAAGSIYFQSVDKSVLGCNNDRGCGTYGSATMDSLVSGSSQSERLANTLDLSSSGHVASTVSAWLENVCYPHTAILRHDKRSCDYWQAKNLGTGFATPQQCAEAAVKDAECPRTQTSPATIMWSDSYSYSWGCRCCLVGYQSKAHQWWDLYEIVESYRITSPPPPPSTPTAHCFEQWPTPRLMPHTILYPFPQEIWVRNPPLTISCRLHVPPLSPMSSH